MLDFDTVYVRTVWVGIGTEILAPAGIIHWDRISRIRNLGLPFFLVLLAQPSEWGPAQQIQEMVGIRMAVWYLGENNKDRIRTLDLAFAPKFMSELGVRSPIEWHKSFEELWPILEELARRMEWSPELFYQMARV